MIAMYGAGPVFPDRWPGDGTAVPGTVGGITIVGPATTPIEPESEASLRRRIKERIDWLKRELGMHEAWKAELAALERMLAEGDK